MVKYLLDLLVLTAGTVSDAEHPTSIPMYTTTTPQAPSGPTMRPQAYAIGHKVNLLLDASPFQSCETWLLPHAKTLHVLRYQEDPLGDAQDHGQVPKYMDEGARRKEPEKVPRPRTSGPWPGHPAPEDVNNNNSQ
jgi:hypothetical protein